MMVMMMTSVEEVTEETATDPPESISEESKRLALFIVLPLFLCCYGGSCILYCVHKIIRNCAKARRVEAPAEEPQVPRAVPVVVGPPPGGLGAREKRPMSSCKVAPAPQPATYVYQSVIDVYQQSMIYTVGQLKWGQLTFLMVIWMHR